MSMKIKQRIDVKCLFPLILDLGPLCTAYSTKEYGVLYKGVRHTLRRNPANWPRSPLVVEKYKESKIYSLQNRLHNRYIITISTEIDKYKLVSRKKI